MTPPKLFTVDQINHWKNSLTNDRYSTPLPGECWIVDREKLERLIATALAAMRVVEAAKAHQIAGIERTDSGVRLVGTLKLFQQTGEDKGGHGDE